MSRLLLTMGPQLSIDAILPQARVGEPAEVVFRAFGAIGVVTWRLISSGLPGEWTPALTIVNDRASLSTPEAQVGGAWPVTILATDDSRVPVVRTFTVAIEATLPEGGLNLVLPWYVPAGDAADLNLTEAW